MEANDKVIAYILVPSINKIALMASLHVKLF